MSNGIFEVDDYVEWEGYRYIVREVHDDYYYIEEANDFGFYNNMPVWAEATPDELNRINNEE